MVLDGTLLCLDVSSVASSVLLRSMSSCSLNIILARRDNDIDC